MGITLGNERFRKTNRLKPNERLIEQNKNDGRQICIAQIIDTSRRVKGRAKGIAPARYPFRPYLRGGTTDLDHVVALGPEARDVRVDVDAALVLGALQHGVDDDEAAGAAHARAAVHHHRAGVGRVDGPDALHELQQWRRMVGYAVVRPRAELQLLDLARLAAVLGARQMERPDHVRGQLLDADQRHGHRPVRLPAAPGRRPVLVALDPRPLLQLGHHDDRGRAHLPAHAPKVAERLLQRALRGHVRVVLAVPVAVVGVYVVAAGRRAVQRPERHARMVVRDHVGVPVLRLVHVRVRMVPRELLARLDRLVLLRELEVVVGLEQLDVLRQVVDRHRRVRHHGRRLELQPPQFHRVVVAVRVVAADQRFRHARRLAVLAGPAPSERHKPENKHDRGD